MYGYVNTCKMQNHTVYNCYLFQRMGTRATPAVDVYLFLDIIHQVLK